MSIAKRLFLLISAIIAGTVAVFATTTINREADIYVQNRLSELSGNASLLATLVAEDTAREDAVGIRQRLAAISRLKDTVFAEVISNDGNIIAQIGDGTVLTPGAIEITTSTQLTIGEVFNTNIIILSEPIVYAGRDIGILRVYGSISILRSQIYSVIINALTFSALLLCIGLLTASILQKSVTEPIQQLTQVMDYIQDNQDYTHQLEVLSNDETGRLTASFNRMIEQIQHRDERLGHHNRELERLVEERTCALNLSKVEAERANAAKTDFLAMISHEIRTPLNGMMVMAEILNRANLQGAQKKHANVILESGKNLLSIINDVLDLSKVEAGKIELESIPFDPRDITDTVQALFEERAKQKGLDLSVHIDPAVPQKLRGDPVRVQQILSNLVNNAVKFTETGSIAISCRFVDAQAYSGDSQDVLYVSVADTGIGIAEDKRDLVFDPFSQADQSTTRKYGGTGLGLSICQRLVSAMGGKISFTSELGDGTRFWFAIPTRRVNMPSALSAAPFGHSIVNEKNLEPLHVLVADDNPINIEVINEVLSSIGMTVQSVGDGASAVEAVKSGEFDAVFMDGSMPVLDGISAMIQIRQWERRIGITPVKIIALTADVAGISRQHWYDAGADDYLTKPYTVDQIRQALIADALQCSNGVINPVQKEDLQSCSSLNRTNHEDEAA